METYNARIEKARLELTAARSSRLELVATVKINAKAYSMTCYFYFCNPYFLHAFIELMEMAKADVIEEMEGRAIRIIVKDGLLYAIGDFFEDKFFLFDKNWHDYRGPVLKYIPLISEGEIRKGDFEHEIQ